MSSRILDLGSDYGNLADVLGEYDDALSDLANNVSLKGKQLERANRENPSWFVYYDQKRVELKTLVEYMELQVQRVRSKLFKSYTENHSRDLDHRGKEKYIDSEPAYLTTQELYLEVKEMYDRYKSAVDSFTTRGYALNNITRARVSDVWDTEL